MIAHFIPPLWMLIAGGPAALCWAYAALWFAGWLKGARGLSTPYSRKVFHFLIFATVASLQATYGPPAVSVFGGAASAIIFYALWRGSGNCLYEAMARETDAPHRTLFIVVPYFATLAGGLTSTMLFGSCALAGYLVAGLADAIAEPIGVRFGKHRYAVLSMRGVKTTRSVEGSGAVLIVSVVMLGMTLWLHESLALDAPHFLMLLGAGLACTVCEAVSPHGWDNLTLQILPAFLAYELAG